jgi:arylamine N-acetyltransferase
VLSVLSVSSVLITPYVEDEYGMDDGLTREVLAYLGVGADVPTLRLLDALLVAYTERVPWESASRIAKRARTRETKDCPRWPEEFWRAALRDGTGGTCFESNYAFFALLRALGFAGYLTINDMHAQIGCHTAIVILLAGEKWLTDVGMPLYLPVPFGPDRQGRRETPFHTYTVRPEGDDTYTVLRDRHPAPYCFTFHDRPIADDAYRAATTDDYEPTGNFNDRVIVTKVINGEIWRFNGVNPPMMESFRDGGRKVHPVGDDVATTVADRFGINRGIVQNALDAVGLFTA